MTLKSRTLTVGLALGISLMAMVADAASPPTAKAISRKTLGRPEQAGALAQRVHEVEHGGRESTTFIDRQPVLNRGKAFLRGASPGVPGRLSHYVDKQENIYRSGVTALTLDHDGVDPRRYGLMVTEKALALQEFHRTPKLVSERFITASGSVDGHDIPARQVFVQHWSPVDAKLDANGKLLPAAKPTGKVYVISPGYTETGRNFYRQIDKLTREGHEVIVMDHQWAGYSEGKPGAIDRGFGVTRDVAAVAAYANQWASKKYPHAEVILLGNSMGAGPGVIGAMAMNDAGKIRLDGAPMPKGMSAIVQAPFLGATPSAINAALALASHVPVVKKAAVIGTGLPILSREKLVQARGADLMSAGDVRTQTGAFTSANRDIQTIRDHVSAIKGKVYVIQSEHDTLADPAVVRDFVTRLGPRAELEVVPGKNHVLEDSEVDGARILNGARWLSEERKER
jgi:alpha-beta hydrolase superfamily lysophospholipase